MYFHAAEVSDCGDAATSRACTSGQARVLLLCVILKTNKATHNTYMHSIVLYYYVSSTDQNSSAEGSVTLLYDHFERIPDNTKVSKPVLCAITRKNSQPHLWATWFEPRDTECAICSATLEHVPGTDANVYLLTKHTMKAIIKLCSHCSARHSYTGIGGKVRNYTFVPKLNVRAYV